MSYRKISTSRKDESFSKSSRNPFVYFGIVASVCTSAPGDAVNGTQHAGAAIKILLLDGDGLDKEGEKICLKV